MAQSLFSFEKIISRTTDQTDLFQFVSQILQNVDYAIEFRDAIRYALEKLIRLRARLPKWLSKMLHAYRRVNHNFQNPEIYLIQLQSLYNRYFRVKAITTDELRELQRWILFYLNQTIPYHFLKRMTRDYELAIRHHDADARERYNNSLQRLNKNNQLTKIDESFQVIHPITLWSFYPELQASLPNIVRGDFQLPLLIWDSRFAQMNHLGEWKVYKDGEGEAD